MATFLQNSLSQLNNGYQQLYGQPAVGATPATPVSYPTAPIAAPVSVNPNVAGSPDMPVMVPVSQLLTGAPVGAPTPIAYNPEVGQPLGASGGDANSGNLLSWLQNFFSSLGIGGQQQQPLSTNAPTLNPDTQVGPATPTIPQVPQTSGGVATSSPAIDQANAANSPLGGMGGGGGNMGGSILSGIGSGLSNMGKQTSSAQSTFTPVNLPLPQRAVFTPPSLSPNTKATY